MYALQLASGTPSALVDWNNNYGDDPNKCVFFHCGNWAKSFLPGTEIAKAPILGTTLGEENTYGAMAGRAPAGPMKLCPRQHRRPSRADPHLRGRWRVHRRPASTPSAPARWSMCRACGELLHHICKNGFEHHVAMSTSHSAAVLAEAFATYLGWDVYHHGA